MQEPDRAFTAAFSHEHFSKGIVWRFVVPHPPEAGEMRSYRSFCAGLSIFQLTDGTCPPFLFSLSLELSQEKAKNAKDRISRLLQTMMILISLTSTEFPSVRAGHS